MLSSQKLYHQMSCSITKIFTLEKKNITSKMYLSNKRIILYTFESYNESIELNRFFFSKFNFLAVLFMVSTIQIKICENSLWIRLFEKNFEATQYTGLHGRKN